MARKHGKRWLANARTAEGDRLRPSFETQREAEAWEAEAKKALEEGRPIPEAKTGKGGGTSGPRSLHTLGALFDHVKATEWQHQRAAETQIKNGQDVLDYFGRKKPVVEIGTQEVGEMMAHFAGRGLAAATCNRKRAALSKLLHVAKAAGIIGTTPSFKARKETQTRFVFLDETEEKVLLAYWKAQGMSDMHDLCVLLIDTGARCFSEMLPVRWEAFGPGLSTVTFWQTKTNLPRTVPLTARCRSILADRKKRLGNHAGPFSGVSHGDQKGFVGKHTLRSQWDAMREATGMEAVTPHTLRHTCCTRLILGGVDVKRVMTWMGHTAITTTMRYMQIKPTALEDVLHVLEGPRAA